MLLNCVRCGNLFDENEEEQDKLCYHCFEESLEQWEEDCRRKIAEMNEF